MICANIASHSYHKNASGFFSIQGVYLRPPGCRTFSVPIWWSETCYLTAFCNLIRFVVLRKLRVWSENFFFSQHSALKFWNKALCTCNSTIGIIVSANINVVNSDLNLSISYSLEETRRCFHWECYFFTFSCININKYKTWTFKHKHVHVRYCSPFISEIGIRCHWKCYY